MRGRDMHVAQAIAIGTVALAAAGAQAGSVVQSGSTPWQTTDFSYTLPIAQFDTRGGERTLSEVRWWVRGMLEGLAEVESLDAGPTTVQLNLSATMSVKLGGATLDDIDVVITESFGAGAFDGVIDFSGLSGASFGPMAGDVEATGLLTSDVSPFVGVGQTILEIDALGFASASGSGNLVTSFNTLAAVEYEIEYVFTEVPAPAAALPLLAAPLLRRRRRGSVCAESA